MDIRTLWIIPYTTLGEKKKAGRGGVDKISYYNQMVSSYENSSLGLLR